MTDRDWAAICALIGGWWPQPFGADEATSWRVALDGYEPAAVIAALHVALADGGEYRSLPRVIRALVDDPSRPTADEALAAIYGRGGVLRARPPYPPGGWTGDEFERAQSACTLARADEIHPLVGAFVRARGLHTLRRLPVDDPEWGWRHRQQLADDWARHCATMAGRDLAAITAPRGTRGLARFDPAAAIGIRPGALPAGDDRP
jgi:hypothetical protein